MSSSDSSRPWAGQPPSPQRSNSTSSPHNNAGAPLRPARSLLRRTGVKSPIGSQSSGRSQSASIKAADSGMARLLVTTRQLLDCLTLWSQSSASEKDVSDVYVKLGNEFNVVCRSFQHLGMDVADLGDVPGSLRGVLEPALALPASAATLERFLPRIRQIFFVLLQGLKTKQNLLRTLQANLANADTPPSQPVHHHSSEGIPQRRPSQAKRTVSGRSASSAASTEDPNNLRSNAGSAQGRRSAASTPADLPSAQSSYFNLETTAAINPRSQPERPGSSTSLHPGGDVRKNKSQVGPDIPLPPTPPGYIQSKSSKSLDALSALQKSEALERRASRRFSAYQMAKMHNAPYISPDQRSSTLRPPGNEDEVQKQRISSGGSKSPSYLVRPSVHTTPPPANGRSSLRRTNIPSSPLYESQTPSPNVNAPPDEPQQPIESKQSPTASSSTVPKDSLVLFVQLGHQVKRVQVPAQGLNMGKLRLIFVEKFSYSPGTDSFPEIYRQDPHTNIRYELDDQEIGHLADSDLLSLNVDPQDEIKKFLSEGMQPISSAVSEIKKSMDEQNNNIKKLASDQDGVNSRLENRIEELSKIRISEASGHSKLAASDDTVNQDSQRRNKIYQDQVNVVSKLRKDIAVMRQVHQDTMNYFTETIGNLAKEATELKNAPPPPGSASRSYISKSYSKLNQDSDGLLAMVDGLQDTVEGLRQDIARRGVRPTPRQLENIMGEMRSARNELESMTHFIKTEKPVWKKIWEKELDTVCEEQQFFTLQEDLVSDLGEDLDRVEETISLVEQCLDQQQKNPPRQVVVGASALLQSKGSTSTLSTNNLQEAVLNDLKTLTPDHDSRVEAIEKAEKQRKKELDTRLDEFERELGQFVGEGKLRKSGGVEETERLRKQREEDVWKSAFGAAPGVLDDNDSDSSGSSSDESDSGSDQGEEEDQTPPESAKPKESATDEVKPEPKAQQLQESAINDDNSGKPTAVPNESIHVIEEKEQSNTAGPTSGKNEVPRPETPQKVPRRPVLDIDVTSGPISPSTPHTPGSQSSRSIPATPRSSSMLLE